MSYSNAPFVLRGCLSSQIASDRGEGGQQQRRAVGSALCLSALLGATDPHLRRRFGLGGWMPSSFVGRAAVLPRVSLVGAVAHISSDLFTEGIYGRSIRAYTDVQGCNLAIASSWFVQLASRTSTTVLGRIWTFKVAIASWFVQSEHA